ncbi:MAG: aldolase catalytic domain-containing protein [Elusimicrobia bacterium]|nr:aldolase catalytic domain-containing protein [Elusimicrobiota bacterium]
MVKGKYKETKGSLITYRPDIKIIDCTVRDGGLMNSHQFDDDFVKRIYNTCIEAGANYMEFGYKASKKMFAKDKFGAWKFCDEEDIRRIIGDKKSQLKICAMADAERTDYHTDILPKQKSVLDCIRVATYINQIPTALDMVKDAHDKGYETTVNLMAVSVVPESELFEALELFAKSPVDVVYIVDSFGAYYPEQIRGLMGHFNKILKGSGKEIGIHTHNNQQLAFANTIEALIWGASRVDSTINGFGRGAGNCSLEILLGFLKNPAYDLRPVLKCIEDLFVPLRENIDWGYSIPYMITGQLNEHPRSAMELRDGENKDKYLDFYDKMLE